MNSKPHITRKKLNSKANGRIEVVLQRRKLNSKQPTNQPLTMCKTNASKYRLQYVGGFGTEFKSSDNYQEIVGVISNDLLR